MGKRPDKYMNKCLVKIKGNTLEGVMVELNLERSFIISQAVEEGVGIPARGRSTFKVANAKENLAHWGS